jgi:hypothetical protein
MKQKGQTQSSTVKNVKTGQSIGTRLKRGERSGISHLAKAFLGSLPFGQFHDHQNVFAGHELSLQRDDPTRPEVESSMGYASSCHPTPTGRFHHSLFLPPTAVGSHIAKIMKMTIICSAVNLHAVDLELAHISSHSPAGDASQGIRVVDEQARFDASGDSDPLIATAITLSPRIHILVAKHSGIRSLRQGSHQWAHLAETEQIAFGGNELIM